MLTVLLRFVQAQLALSVDGQHSVSLDEAIAAMRETAKDMSTKYVFSHPETRMLDHSDVLIELSSACRYKETSRAGLAVRRQSLLLCSISPWSVDECFVGFATRPTSEELASRSRFPIAEQSLDALARSLRWRLVVAMVLQLEL